MEEAVRFNSCPEFDFIGGKTDVIGGDILTGGRIHIEPAVFGIEPVDFVG